MKKINFKAIAFIAITSITSLSFAQDSTSKSSGKTMASDDWQAPNAKVATGKHFPKATLTCRVVATDDGCTIVFENDVVSPRDAASGLSTGRRQHKPYSFIVSSSDNSVTEVKSPRDAASGLATGKRQHKPITIIKEYDKATPKLMETVAKGKSSSSSEASEFSIGEPGVQKVSSSGSTTTSEIAIDEPGVHKVSGSGMGAGKVSVSDLSIMSAGKASFKEFTITKRCDGKTTKIVCPDGECTIPLDDCPDGTCSLIASWSWGASNPSTTTSGGGSGRCSVDFLLEIKDRACWDLAVQKK